MNEPFDSDELARLADKARDAEARYHTLFANAHDAIAVLGLDGTILEVNRRWSEVLGVDPATLVGRNIGDYAAAGNRDPMMSAFGALVGAGGGHTAPVPLRHGAGERTVYMTFSSTVIQLEGRQVVFSVGHDVTAAILAERSLAAAQSKYRALVERMPDVVWTADQDGRITFATANVATVCGLTEDEVRAGGIAGWFARIHPGDQGTVRAAYEALFAGARPTSLEYRWQHPDGRWLWLRDRPIAAYPHDGITCVDGMLSDVTERRRLEESLQQAQKMDAIGRLTGGIAHDFNNILSGILASARFLQADLAVDDPRRADAVDIEQAGERAAELVRQLLAFSRRQVMAPAVVQLDAVLAGLEGMLRRLIGEDIELRVTTEPGLGAVRVDVGQIEQVVVNLVANARDAMSLGGVLTIDTRNADVEEPAVPGGPPPGAHVVLTVTDTGRGMDADTRRRIFEPFFTTKERGRGAGLGLSTCYGIVHQSSGHIAVQSEVGQGTTVRIYLPRIDVVRREPVPKVHQELRGTETILVVEDDDKVRSSVLRLLAPCGYQLLSARDGADALAVAGRHDGPIHLVVSDVIMPGMNGLETVAQLHDRFPDARALFMSGYSDHIVLRNAAERGDLDFIQKPFTTRGLLAKVREILDRR